MKFSVCIPSVRATTLGITIESIRRQTWTDWELIVVGQGSDSSVRLVVEAIAAQDDRVRYVHAEVRGLSRARNTAILAATAEVLAFIDDDCEAREDWLETMAEYFTKYPDYQLVGGALVRPKKKPFSLGVCPAIMPAEAFYDPQATPQQAPARWDWIGGNFGFRRSVIEQVGLFDENLGPGTPFPSGEDTDYKFRFEAKGIKMLSTPRLVVYHTHGYRYGLKAILKHEYNYAYGLGAMTGKLTLMGDERGKEWVDYMKRLSFFGWLRPFRPHQVLVGWFRWRNYKAAYERCLREYEVKHGMLVKR
jgi:glycosyltransferase involved in cell wall biosynthesis